MSDYEHKRAGRCAAHNDLAWLFNDGSVMCMYDLAVEGAAEPCEWETMPEAWGMGDGVPTPRTTVRSSERIERFEYTSQSPFPVRRGAR